ncbi:hypothetical protein EVAR_53856_1 [Eumeta japonica]|uniref:Uncharacterized protein n=1 Tax=Eumeta variegata TaxID=151549 RepID=A0A4C1XF94_EUMVA|nr:hypothetical protein EVAR_53856_1 [Eumeta japonica]
MASLCLHADSGVRSAKRPRSRKTPNINLVHTIALAITGNALAEVLQRRVRRDGPASTKLDNFNVIKTMFEKRFKFDVGSESKPRLQSGSRSRAWAKSLRNKMKSVKKIEVVRAFRCRRLRAGRATRGRNVSLCIVLRPFLRVIRDVFGLDLVLFHSPFSFGFGMWKKTFVPTSARLAKTFNHEPHRNADPDALSTLAFI